MRRRTTLVTRALACLLTLLPSTAAAQATPTFSISITESSELIENAGTTRCIGHAEIRARNARTLDEALRLLLSGDGFRVRRTHHDQ